MELARNKIKKFSAVPIYLDFAEELKIPLKLSDDITVDSLKGRFDAKHFALWKQYLPKDSLERLTGMNYALIHQFISSMGSGEKEEASKDLLHKAFICLRIVKPTRTAFALVQFTYAEDQEPDIFSFIEPENPLSLALPESEVLNHLTLSDLLRVRQLLPKFLATYTDDHSGQLRRAIKCYEIGYSRTDDISIQFIVWMMGIEALFSTGQEPYNTALIKEHIRNTVGAKADIYEEFEDRELYHADPVFIENILDDLFTLRNLFIHGRWIPEEWIRKNMRDAISTGSISYADVLREAASFILRRAILQLLDIHQPSRA